MSKPVGRRVPFGRIPLIDFYNFFRLSFRLVMTQVAVAAAVLCAPATSGWSTTFSLSTPKMDWSSRTWKS